MINRIKKLINKEKPQMSLYVDYLKLA